MPISSSCARAALALAALMAAVAQGLPAQAAGPDMLTRAQWGAKAPIAKMRRQTPSRILIHHTASRQKPGTSLSAKMASLQRFSQSREKLSDGRMKPAWPDVPYHFYIGANGGIAEGRDISAVGDTNTGYNPAGYIQIVLEGNFESEQPSPAQMAALDRLVRSLMTQYGIAPSGIGSHRQVAQTACPGKNLEALMPDFVASLQAKGG